MSTKDLFDKSTNYVSSTSQKDAFADAESSHNVKQIVEKQRTFEPQVDYTDPKSFAKYGSAELYYKSAITRIVDFYPYDGSDAEYNEFYNKSLDIEKYVFNNLYPRTNGYVNFYQNYISLKGGPHTIASSTSKGLFKDPESSQRASANIYDADIYATEGLQSDYGEGTRESNLKCDFDKGVTVEFWLKTDAIASADKKAVFHLTNPAGDEMSIFLSGTTGSPFHVSLTSSAGGVFKDEQIGTTPTTSSITDWNHYAISFKNETGVGVQTKLYLNGVIDASGTFGTAESPVLTQTGTLAYIASGSAAESHGFLSGSMDEFRFWKAERSARDIGRHWFTQVRGGSNTDISNATLGVYYKFNEGITGDATQDSVVLDYSGRISNGTFNSYNALTSRNTGSAIVEASASAAEYKDPVIYSNHPDVVSLKADLISTGSVYDSNNGASMVGTIPSWVIEDHEDKENDNLKNMAHIVGAYFDRLRLQIEALPTFKSDIYTSGSHKPLPFAQNLPSSLGLETPQVFIDAEVQERFLNRNNTENYESDLEEAKNLVYLNLYNNLSYIFKSKGTEKAIRNVLRTFNIDDKLVRLNTYANNYVYDLQDNLRQTRVLKSALNFNNFENTGAVVYSTGSTSTTELGYISSSATNDHESRYGFTYEVDLIFPKFKRQIDTFERDFTEVSLFGIHSASAATADTTIHDPSIYVYADRDEIYSKNVKFRLSSSLLATELESDPFLGVYNDEEWNLSVRLRPDTFGLTGSVAGATASDYILEFTGYNQRLGKLNNSFTITSSVSVVGDAQSLLSSPKRVYLGAQRENVTGSLNTKSDVLISSARFWLKNLDDASLKQHAYDFENYGITHASRHLSPNDPDNKRTLNSNTLVLNYEFRDVTSSNASGQFTTEDISSGSVANRSKYGKIGEVSSYLYPASGSFFGYSSTKAVIKKEINVHQFISPELAIGSNLVTSRTEDDKLFDSVDTIPNYHYVLEKSMYNAISEEMLNFFAGVVDFNNLIGAPVHQYRMNYKGLEKLRQTFFEKVDDVTQVERFVDYYKWFDDSVSSIIGQLIPASADYTPDILNTIESHALERNKYQYRFPMVAHTSSTEGVAFGAQELRYNWDRNHAPVTGDQADNSDWWKNRAERDGTVITSGDINVDAGRQTLLDSANHNAIDKHGNVSTIAGAAYKLSPFRYKTLSKNVVYEIKESLEIGGGVNFPKNKKIHYAYAATYPAGPINVITGTVVPLNVLLARAESFYSVEDSNDANLPPSAKIKRHALVESGRDYEDGIGYVNMKSDIAFPFNMVSSSVTTGYNAEVVSGLMAGVEVTNLHNDVYGPDMERPMQGPFTEYAVGGHQSRHVALNSGSDDHTNRPEAWRIAIGAAVSVTGAIGLVGADYPFPVAGAYPQTLQAKAPYFRDEVAKRPVNIRNIQHTTGSTILGNYDHNYQVVNVAGAYSNPRAFIEQQPTLPAKAVGADVVKTFIDKDRGAGGHFVFMDDYDSGYLTGTADSNKTVIKSRFSAPGGPSTMNDSVRDVRSGEFSVYNTINNRNLSVRRKSQNHAGTVVSTTAGLRNFDHTGKDFGLSVLSARRSARFYRDGIFTPTTEYSNVPRNQFVPSPTAPGGADDAGTQTGSFHRVHRNNLQLPTDTSGVCRYVYDNLNVNHQIPRSDRQYSWIAHSITNIDGCDPRYSGFMRTDSPLAPYYEITGNYFPFFDYVSSSATISGYAQNTTRNNILVTEPVDSATNTLGATTIANTPLAITPPNTRFNQLMIKRGDTFGWNWRATRQQDHPVILAEKKTNRITALNNGTLEDYTLQPVSMRGRPAMANFDVSGKNITLKSTHNNEKIYFNDRGMNELVFQTDDPTVTPFDEIIQTAQAYNLNWVRYSETLFPSSKNSFQTKTRERTGYSNNYWRTNNTFRVILGSSGSTTAGLGYNTLLAEVSQSSWVLDAPDDFATRTDTISGSSLDPAFSAEKSGSAGELQNEYLYHKDTSALATPRAGSYAPAAIYALKQNMTSPNSVVSRTGFAITGSLTDSFADAIDNFGGEALWEAGENATINVKSGDTYTTEASASAPWFDTYDDFKKELQLVAKDFAIVPEFRISEHIEDYAKGGLNNPSKLDTFEIPGTGISSADNSFYKDYSNSDFLKEFGEIKEKSSLPASEIMLTCKAAIRFNPYEGFYPAQRAAKLVSQFSSSFAAGISYGSGLANDTFDPNAFGKSGARPLLQPLFSPGILFNSIKSGIAVDFPVLSRELTTNTENYTGSVSTNENYMLSPLRSTIAASGSLETVPSGSQIWDFRVPFEAILSPGKYIDKKLFLDFVEHERVRSTMSASLDTSVGDGIYEMMSKNFLGQTADFFLKDSKFSSLKSDLLQDNLTFSDGDVFAARLKIRKSHNGKRFYTNESGSDGSSNNFALHGAQAFSGSGLGVDLTPVSGSFPLPQDPAHNSDFQETFTMYSRPSAFGPAVSGRSYENVGGTSFYEDAFLSGTLDSVEGYNWAYTPPYYHGESWVDFIFRPDSTKSYTMEEILAEMETVYWRVDPGQISGSGPTGAPSVGTQNPKLIHSQIYFDQTAFSAGMVHPIYGGMAINENAMQLSSSFNLFGVERVNKQRKDKFGNTIQSENELAGKRWVIQPKWESPMLNFKDVDLNNGNITYPSTFSESVPRGMWHQFGKIPTDPSTGVFMEIEDIPSDWLRYHYKVINEDTVYNGGSAADSGSEAHLYYKSLTDLFGFNRSQKKDSAKVRMGELAEKREVYEAVVAIPYIVQSDDNSAASQDTDAMNRKKFISIPKPRFEAALKNREGSADGDSLEASGESIRKMVQKMKRYVLPPQFDFINFDEIDPVVMYFFEFKYELDKDDLSYIWQNLAPRDFEKITFQEASVAHDLMNTELLEESNIIDNPNLRWMVFKVKQKAGKDYYDLIETQAKSARPTTTLDTSDTDKDKEYTQFNWPYDYLSFVELVRMEADVLYKDEPDSQ